MINKQERFLVMSEAEFMNVINAAIVHGYVSNVDSLHLLNQAEAACRAREVKPTQLGFHDQQMWVEIKK